MERIKYMTFSGEFKHTIDDKSRLSLPAKFRKELGSKIVLTRGFDPCISIYRPKDWERIEKRILDNSSPFQDKKTRMIEQGLYTGMTETTIDSNGRILIPQFLKEEMGINQNQTIVLCGVGTRLEIWNEKNWKSHLREIRSVMKY